MNGFTDDEQVLLTYDRILSFIAEMDMQFSKPEMYEALCYRVHETGFSKEVTDRIIALIKHVAEHGGADEH